MSKRVIGKVRASSTSRGSAGSVPTGQHGVGGGQGPSSSGRARWSNYLRSRRAIDPRHAPDIVEWINNPSTSSSSSVSQAGSSSKSTSTTEGITRHSAALSIATPAIDPAKGTELSAELFDHSINQLMLEDSQQLIGPETEEGGNLNSEKGGATDQISIRVRAATSYCHVVPDDEEDTGDHEDSDRTWVPDRAEEEEQEEESEVETRRQEGRISSRGSRQSRVRSSSQSISSDVRPVLSTHSSHSSTVWAFFDTCATERTTAICNICLTRIKRGQDINHLGTTCLRRHLEKHHSSRWQEHLKATPSKKGRTAVAPYTAPASAPPPAAPRSSNPSSSLNRHPSASVSASDRDEEFATGLNLSGSSSSSISSSTPPAPAYFRQMSLPQLLQRKRKYSPCHPHAKRLNASLAKLLALQLLPFRLVDSCAFREFAECAIPQWKVPSRYFFARKAIPSLYHHVEGNVLLSLSKAVSSKVHITADSWSSKHGQGRYVSFTAHWVTLLAAGKDAGQGSVLELVVPPRLLTAGGVAAAVAAVPVPSKWRSPISQDPDPCSTGVHMEPFSTPAPKVLV